VFHARARAVSAGVEIRHRERRSSARVSADEFADGHVPPGVWDGECRSELPAGTLREDRFVPEQEPNEWDRDRDAPSEAADVRQERSVVEHGLDGGDADEQEDPKPIDDPDADRLAGTRKIPDGFVATSADVATPIPARMVPWPTHGRTNARKRSDCSVPNG
jgi:hypothetical protein